MSKLSMALFYVSLQLQVAIFILSRKLFFFNLKKG